MEGVEDIGCQKGAPGYDRVRINKVEQAVLFQIWTVGESSQYTGLSHIPLPVVI